MAAHTAQEKAAVAVIVDRISKNLLAEAELMEKQCAHPPCQHAQGIRLAQTSVIDLFTDYVNEGVPYIDPMNPKVDA